MSSLHFDIVIWQEHVNTFMWTIRSGGVLRSSGVLQREGDATTMNAAKAEAYASLRELLVDND